MKAEEMFGVGGYRCAYIIGSCRSRLIFNIPFVDVGNGGYEPLYAGQPAGQVPVNYGATR